MIYIVTSGSYSDFSIKCVFKDKYKAEKYVNAYNKNDSYSDYRIEEYEFYDSSFKAGSLYYEYHILQNYRESDIDNKFKQGYKEKKQDREIETYFDDCIKPAIFYNTHTIATIRSFISLDDLKEICNRVFQEFTQYKALKQGDI